MFSTLSRLGSVRHLKERSTSVRRSSLERRPRPSSDLGQDVPPSLDSKNGQEEDLEDLEEEDIDEDGDEEMEPLLPIFSAAHLGKRLVPTKFHFDNI